MFFLSFLLCSVCGYARTGEPVTPTKISISKPAAVRKIRQVERDYGQEQRECVRRASFSISVYPVSPFLPDWEGPSDYLLQPFVTNEVIGRYVQRLLNSYLLHLFPSHYFW